MRDLENRLREISGGDILDIACGRGWFSKLILDSMHDYNSLTGIELTDIYKKEFYEILGECNVRYEVANIYDYIESNNKFDTVTMSYSMHHLEKLSYILRNIHKLLKPNGTIIINEMYKDNLTEAQITQKNIHELGAEIDRLNGKYHAQVYTIKEIGNLIQLANLDEYEIILTKNDKKVNNDNDYHKNLIKLLINKLYEIYEENIPEDLMLKVDYAKDRLDKYGICSPPMMTIIGKIK